MSNQLLLTDVAKITGLSESTIKKYYCRADMINSIKSKVVNRKTIHKIDIDSLPLLYGYLSGSRNFMFNKKKLNNLQGLILTYKSRN